MIDTDGLKLTADGRIALKRVEFGECAGILPGGAVVETWADADEILIAIGKGIPLASYCDAAIVVTVSWDDGETLTVRPGFTSLVLGECLPTIISAHWDRLASYGSTEDGVYPDGIDYGDIDWADECLARYDINGKEG